MSKNKSPESIIESFVTPIFNDIEVGIALVDSDGLIQWMNKTMEIWFGPLEELVSFPCEKFCQSKGKNCCIDQAKATGRKTETSISNKAEDGTTRYFLLNTYPIENPPSEKYNFILLVRETTEFEQSTQTLKQTEARFQAIVESTFTGIAVADLNGYILYANLVSARMFGYASPDEVVGLNGKDLVARKNSEEANQLVRRVLEGEKFQEAPILMVRKNGTTFFANMSASTLLDQKKQPYQILITVHDITETLQVEKTQDAIYQIATVVGSAEKLEDVYPNIHNIIKGIMPANNFYIALLNHTDNTISFPYFVDEHDPRPTTPLPLDEKSITAYVLRKAESLLCTAEVSKILHQQGEVEIVGTEPATWLGAPLLIDGKPIGVIAMQHYQDPDAYTPKDQRILEFVSTEVAKAIQNKRTEKALLESERRFRNIIEASPLGMHLYRLMPDGGLIFIAANHSADQILGLDCSQFIGNTIEEAFPSLIDAKALLALKDVIANGGIWQNRQITYEDNQIIGGFDLYAFQTSKNEFAVLFQDISERLHTEHALIESEKRFRSVVEGSPMGIFIYHLTESGELIFLESNPAADEILGVDCQQFIGQTIEKAFPALVETEVPTIYRKIAANGGVWHTNDIQYNDGRISGAYEVFAFQISPMLMAVNYQDVTNRKKNEEEITRLNEELEERVIQRTAQLEAANQELEAFAYSVSHDLRAPVRSIKGFTELLMQDDHPLAEEEVREFLGRIYQSSIIMDKLIDDLLSLSYLENQELEIHTINLSQMVADISNQLEKDYPKAKLNIQDTPTTRADKDMVQIMLTNLITNAYKFTAEKAQPEITFGSQVNNIGTTYYLKDNGIGFEMQYAEKIFAPFERLHSTEYEGTGIGLAIVRRVIQRHKGRIWAVSELNQGTTFYFSFGTDQAII